MWLSHFFMKGSSAAAFNARLYLTPTSSSNTHRTEERMLRTSPEVVNHLLETCATDKVIAEKDAALTHYCQSPATLRTQLEEALVTESLRCLNVCDEYVLKGIFIEALHESIHHSSR